MDDYELLQKISRGDAKAFETLLKKHQRAVYGMSLRLLGSSQLAEENAQETWIRVVNAAATYQPQAAALSWILKIAKNLALNVLDKRGWEEELSPEKEDRLENEESDLELNFEQGETLQKLKNAVAKLPDRQRVALVLWMEEEKSYAELAQELKINVNAVKVLLFRAKENVQKWMQEDR
jgi:RNA polymerase sigma-70 factor (ECF subfamily)